MTKKRLVLLSGGTLIALLLAGLVGVSVVLAQEPTPESPIPPGRPGFARGGLSWARGGAWTVFDAVAEALGLTPEELFGELHDGNSLEEIAEAQGVDMEAVKDAVRAARAEAQKQAIEQAVEDGKLSREQADWMLEGLEKGYFPRGRGFRGGRPRRGTGEGFDSEDV